eukprot:TRINITY_DN35366_c0_g1_i1.p1 TRINITY_DN35366_c0_g1~~TRINITY_DN35366_c0_g1_i1.p1  ORF type:complete len:621 (+),score=73.78 TRINITY_DN35366_c0_g1_i1:129-1991(+)
MEAAPTFSYLPCAYPFGCEHEIVATALRQTPPPTALPRRITSRCCSPLGSDSGAVDASYASWWNGLLCSAGIAILASRHIGRRRCCGRSTAMRQLGAIVPTASAVAVSAAIDPRIGRSCESWFDRLCEDAETLLNHSRSLPSDTSSKFGLDLLESGEIGLNAAITPARSQEAWRYTDLQGLLFDHPYEDEAALVNLPGSGAELDSLVAALLEEDPSDNLVGAELCPRLVFVDGELSDTLSRGRDGTDTFIGGSHALRRVVAAHDGSVAATNRAARTIEILGALPEVNAFPRPLSPRDALGCAKLVSLNQLLLTDCACVSLEPTQSDAAEASEDSLRVEVVFVTTGRKAPCDKGGAKSLCTSPRVVLDVGRNRCVHLVESHMSLIPSDVSLSNGLCQVLVAEGAIVKHELFQQKGNRARHVETLTAEVSSGGSYCLRVMQTGSCVSRINVGIALAGESSSCEVRGVTLASKKQQLDLHTLIHHMEPRCRSKQQQKNIVADSAECIFKGTIRVDKEAQETDSEQIIRTLLLSKKARVKVMPSLQIRADDVACSHGAAITELDKHQVFYLSSRGLSTMESKKLLLVAFPQDLLGGVQQTAPKAYERVLDKLAQIAQADIDVDS